jgi:hypothetical protein
VHVSQILCLGVNVLLLCTVCKKSIETVLLYIIMIRSSYRVNLVLGLCGYPTPDTTPRVFADTRPQKSWIFQFPGPGTWKTGYFLHIFFNFNFGISLFKQWFCSTTDYFGHFAFTPIFHFKLLPEQKPEHVYYPKPGPDRPLYYHEIFVITLHQNLLTCATKEYIWNVITVFTRSINKCGFEFHHLFCIALYSAAPRKETH